jgi:hypothetical protein
MIPDDLSRTSLLSALDGASIVYSDGRLHETALIVAQEVIFICFPSSFFDTSLLIFRPKLILLFEVDGIRNLVVMIRYKVKQETKIFFFFDHGTVVN